MDKEVFYGEVVWFSIGPKTNYGFISWEKDGVKQKDMFVHYSDILMKGFKYLKAGQKVRFSIGKNNSGQDKAIEVELLT